MKDIQSMQLLSLRRFAWIAAAGLWAALANGAEPVVLTPGATTSLAINAEGTGTDCSTVEQASENPLYVHEFWSYGAACSADKASDPQLKVFALSALSTGLLGQGTFSSLQDFSSTAKLSREITIPEPAEEPFSNTLRVQVGTEVGWSGGFVAAGVRSTYAQIIATLQIRDVTDAPDGPVVASNTFFRERFDAQLDLPTDLNNCDDDDDEEDDEDPPPCIPLSILQALNLVDAIDVSNSSGADLTAFLRRGRTYAIELQAKCDVGVPALGFAMCLFGGDTLGLTSSNPLSTVFANDGFNAAPFEVTVETDPVETTVNLLSQL